jgi:hypothetical protein
VEGEKGVEALMEEDEVLEEAFLQKSVVRVQIVDHLHALVRDITVLKGQLFDQMHQRLSEAEIVIPQGADFFADGSQLLGVNVGLIGIVVYQCLKSRECLLSVFELLSQLEV